MSYAAVEAGLLSRLQSIQGFRADAVVHGNWQLLSRGSNPAIVLTYGGFIAEDVMQPGVRQITWTIMCNLCVRYQTDAQVHSEAMTYRQRIMERVQAYPTLNRVTGVLQASVMAGAPVNPAHPQFDPLPFGGHKYYIERIQVNIVEDLAVTLAE